MELDKQVVSFDLARKLKELGAPQDSYYKWHEFNQTDSVLIVAGFTPVERWNYAAFTVAEMEELLPRDIEDYEYTMIIFINSTMEWVITYETAYDHAIASISHVSLVEACGLMLAWLIEQGYVKFGEVGK